MPPKLPEPPPDTAFDGRTYLPQRDYIRLKGQLGKVFALMRDAKWRTLVDIKRVVGGSEAAISARLRDLRKEKYGAHDVDREHLGDGLFMYRLIVNRDSMRRMTRFATKK
jgi:hypothetical protein